MKAQSRKRKYAQRGRPRDEDCDRTPSGQKSRASPPKEDPRKTCIEARMRIHRLPAAFTDERDVKHEGRDVAALAFAGTALGRQYLAGNITIEMFDAGEHYRELHFSYERAIKAPDSLVVGGKVGDGGDLVSKDYIDWAIRAATNFKLARDTLRSHWARFRAVELVVVFDTDPPSYLIPALVAGLDSLAE